MLIPNHPDEERLSALASLDTDAMADGELTQHVAACVRCTDTVAELGGLRAALANLPDLKPSRPLQLIPGVESGTTAPDPVGGWARRLFAPFLMAGATLAFVGLVGTTLPALGGMASSGAMPLSNGAETAASEPAAAGAQGGSGEQPAAAVPSVEQYRDYSGEGAQPSAQGAEPAPTADDNQAAVADGGESTTLTSQVERSIWPVLLFAGVALIICALLMRWILAPRAG